MKPSELKLLENLYNFLGANETLLQSEFKKLRKKIPKLKNEFTYAQFCITTYSNLNENSTTTKSSK